MSAGSAGSPRQRLDAALAHLEAAAGHGDDADPGRAGLAYVEVLRARDELLALECSRRDLLSADAGGESEAAAHRTYERLLSLVTT